MSEQHASQDQSPGQDRSSGLMPEFILCVSGRTDVPFGLTPLGSPGDLHRYFDSARMVLVPRERVDPEDKTKDTSYFKQLIAYVVLVHGPHVFAYRRIPGTGEPDLAGKRSVGLGGHVNTWDITVAGRAGGGLASVIHRAAMREIIEEVEPPSDEVAHVWSVRPVALLYDPSNPVGRRHIGVVFRADVGGRGEVQLRPGLEPLGWQTPAEVLAGDEPPLETWSRIVMERPEVLGLEGTSLSDQEVAEGRAISDRLRDDPGDWTEFLGDGT